MHRRWSKYYILISVQFYLMKIADVFVHRAVWLHFQTSNNHIVFCPLNSKRANMCADIHIVYVKYVPVLLFNFTQHTCWSFGVFPSFQWYVPEGQGLWLFLQRGHWSGLKEREHTQNSHWTKPASIFIDIELLIMILCWLMSWDYFSHGPFISIFFQIQFYLTVLTVFGQLKKYNDTPFIVP